MLLHNINLKYDHETKLHLWLSQFHGCPSPPPPGRFSGLCHFVGPGGVEFVRKPLAGDDGATDISVKYFLHTYASKDKCGFRSMTALPHSFFCNRLTTCFPLS